MSDPARAHQDELDQAHHHVADGTTQRFAAPTAPAPQQQPPLVLVPPPAPKAASPKILLIIGIVATIAAIAAAIGVAVVRGDGTREEALALAAETEDVLDGTLDVSRLDSVADDLGDLGRDATTLARDARGPKEVRGYVAALGEFLAQAEAVADDPAQDVRSSTFDDLEDASAALEAAADAWNAANADERVPSFDADELLRTQRDAKAAYVAKRAAITKANANVAATRRSLTTMRRDFKTLADRYEASRSATANWAARVEGSYYMELGYGHFDELESQIAARRALLTQVKTMEAAAPASVKPALASYGGVLGEAINGLAAAHSAMVETSSYWSGPVFVEGSPAWSQFEQVSRSISPRLAPARTAVAAAIDKAVANAKVKPVPPAPAP